MDNQEGPEEKIQALNEKIRVLEQKMMYDDLARAGIMRAVTETKADKQQVYLEFQTVNL